LTNKCDYIQEVPWLIWHTKYGPNRQDARHIDSYPHPAMDQHTMDQHRSAWACWTRPAYL